jgi:hypothetical protein
MMMMIMIMSMGWDYVSELRPPTGLLFIPQVIYACGEPWWNNVNRRKLLIRLQELSGNFTSSHLVASMRNGRRKLWIQPREVFLFILASDFLHATKSYDAGLPALLPLRRKACCGFLSPLKNPSPRPGLNPQMASMLTFTPPRRLVPSVLTRTVKMKPVTNLSLPNSLRSHGRCKYAVT